MLARCLITKLLRNLAGTLVCWRVALSQNCSAILRERLSSFRLAGFECAFEFFPIQVPANEDDPAFAFFVRFPGALVVTFDNHVNTLHHIALFIIIKGNNAFQAQNIRPFHLGGFLDPGKEPVWNKWSCPE